MATHKIALLGGDGIGQEVTPEARRVLEVVGKATGASFEFETALVGGAAIDAITGLKGRLQDYQLRSVTSGKDALGEVSVKVDFDGTVVPGKGSSTDVIEASARAYVNALNRLVQPAGGQKLKEIGP